MHSTLPTFFRGAAVGVAAVLAFFSALAAGERAASADATDPDVVRLDAAGHSLKTNLVPPGKSAVFGHAEALVNAPLAKVVEVATDIAHYKDLVPGKFEQTRIVGKDTKTGETDLYMRLPVMNGLVTLWDVLRFAPPARDGTDAVRFEGRFVKGNVRDACILVTVKSVDPNFTVLKVDLFVAPTLPAPQSAVDEELRDAAGAAVDALHDRAQGNGRTVAFAKTP
jgi:hypothetical protein